MYLRRDTVKAWANDLLSERCFIDTTKADAPTLHVESINEFVDDRGKLLLAQRFTRARYLTEIDELSVGIKGLAGTDPHSQIPILDSNTRQGIENRRAIAYGTPWRNFEVPIFDTDRLVAAPSPQRGIYLHVGFSCRWFFPVAVGTLRLPLCPRRSSSRLP